MSTPESGEARRNRLAQETSPYLLQHQTNPVDWYPWGAEALERARTEDKPIFLSIGYSACHWCHVMEHESFEDEAIAAYLNEHFVSIKVDREERPDLDEIYMRAVQALTGQGGWPMSVFLTPDLEPFYGGTYFPPEDKYGRPGFASLLRFLQKLWTEDRARVHKQGASLTDSIQSQATADLSGELPASVLDASLKTLASSFDAEWGGFTGPPKFPHATDGRLMLRHHRRTGEDVVLHMVTYTLDRMARGGIWDHLAGGFARYSTDEKWLIPHFEKMLYDNALLTPLYLEAYLLTGDASFARTARETCLWMAEEMRTPEGGLASSLDADTEGEEGRYYVWTPGQLTAVLGDELGAEAAVWFGVTDAGNFEHGTSALWRPETAQEVADRLGRTPEALEERMQTAREKLLAARAERVAPGKDDKVLASWNGLALSALAQAHQVLDEPRFLEVAQGIARYCLEGMRAENGRLYATARHGRAHLAAYLDDYAFLIAGLIDLYESDFDLHWIEEALALNEVLTDAFEDKQAGGYFTTASDHERLLVRMKVPYDGALPSGSSVQVHNLLRLGAMTGNPEHRARAEKAIASVGRAASGHARAFSQLLLAIDHREQAPREIVLAGTRGSDAFEGLLREVRGTYLPQRVVAHAAGEAASELLPVLAGKTAPEGEARAYVCRDFTCGVPARTVEELREQLAH